MKRRVRANGVDVCVEAFGEPDAPALLLIAGAAMSMDWWEDEFCERLAEGPRFVIRYDLRDTGQSVTYPPGRPGYSGLDLVQDAVGVLDALGLPRAHLVGISMGGGIAQRLTLDRPGRVASLTLVSTSTVESGDRSALPPVAATLKDFFDNPPAEPDWSDRAAVIDYIVEGQRPYTGSVTLDAASLRRLVEDVVDRTIDIHSTMANHWLLESGVPAQRRLAEIAVPTLVLHGSEDPLFPLGHGEALAAEIPRASLVPLAGVGHEVPPPQTWDVVAPAILDLSEDRDGPSRGTAAAARSAGTASRSRGRT